MLGVVPRYYDQGHRDGVSPRLPAKWYYIEETGYLCPVNVKPEEDSEGFSGRLVDQSNIDFDILNHWISFCHENHKKLCKLSEEISLPGFRVIDCYTRHLVSVSIGYSYVVLSYVWVPLLRHFKLPTNNSLPNAGNVIEDSIIVVKKLNLRYLWVDRYCAPQDGEDKHSQIQTMDLIYKNAEVTIIALAGKHSSAGLPGIGRTPRIPQPHIVLGDITLVSSLLSLRTLIKRSVWGRRGWTYQEGAIPRRRLVFTEHQVYFECMGMHCQESIATPLKTLHTRDL